MQYTIGIERNEKSEIKKLASWGDISFIILSRKGFSR